MSLHRYLIITLFLLWTALCNAQFFDHVDQPGVLSYYSDIERVQSGDFVVTGFESLAGAFSQSVLAELDQNGNLTSQWNFNVSGNEYTFLKWVDLLSNGDRLLMGTTSIGCDFGPFRPHIRVLSGGTELWQNTYNFGYPQSMISNDSMIIISSIDSVLLLDIAGLELSRFASMGTWYSYTSAYSNGFSLWGYDGIALYDINGIMSSSIAALNIQDALELDNGDWIVFTVDSALLLNSALQRTGFGFPVLGDDPRLLIDNDTNTIIHTRNELIMIDDQLNVQGTVALAHPNGWNTTEALVHDTMLTLVGRFNTLGVESFARRNFSLSGYSNTLTMDVALSGVYADSTSYTTSTPTAGITTISGEAWISAWVKNNGDALLTSFTLNDVIPGLCGQGGHTYPTTNTSIAAGDSVLVQAGPFRLYDNVPTGATAEVDICVIVASPNDHLDRDVSNNEFCGRISLALGIDEQILLDAELFPNPTREHLNILFPSPLSDKTMLQIYDLSGRVVLSQSLSSGSTQTRIALSGLRSGSYILQLTDKTTSHSKHFVVH